MTPFEIGVLIGLGLIWWAIADAVRRIEKLLVRTNDQLSALDDLIGRIPGVETYVVPDGTEWSHQQSRNPGANPHNRRNWIP